MKTTLIAVLVTLAALDQESSLYNIPPDSHALFLIEPINVAYYRFSEREAWQEAFDVQQFEKTVVIRRIGHYRLETRKKAYLYDWTVRRTGFKE